MKLLVIFPLLLKLSGCAIDGTARIVIAEKQGGIISIPVVDDNYKNQNNKRKAFSLMTEKCGGKYEIYKEEEVPIGNIEETIIYQENSRKTVLQTKRYDYRISYRCK